MDSLKISIHDFIESLIKGLEARDLYTSGHSIRVAHLSCEIASEMGLDEEIINRIHISGHLHDIGKIGISDKILNKEESLENWEYERLKEHSEIGYNIVKEIKGFEEISKIILYHHEWYNGNGYPKGIKVNDIPIESRIISVADAFDAMVSDRAYRKALSIDEAIARLIKGKGSQFDPKIVDIFLKIKKNEYEKDKVS